MKAVKKAVNHCVPRQADCEKFLKFDDVAH